MVTTAAAIAVAIAVLLLCIELLLVVYARVVVRSALDEGARSGSRADASDEVCLERSQAVLADLLGGALGSEVEIECETAQGLVTARAILRIDGTLPGVPTWGPFTVTASSVKEPFAP